MPAHIVILRDGVSESQEEMAKNYEKAEVELAIKDVKEDYQPTITYIIVRKRESQPSRFMVDQEVADVKINKTIVLVKQLAL